MCVRSFLALLTLNEELHGSIMHNQCTILELFLTQDNVLGLGQGTTTLLCCNLPADHMYCFLHGPTNLMFFFF